ncbi:MAG TPA: PrsW family intramembrane metalloprotease [Actinomycetota bacterium]|nr:PrsW family intramembrane metalloprotease [Actinomycetota bacterium]
MATPETAALPGRPGRGYRTSLWQVRQPAFWLFMVLLVLSTIAAVLIQVGVLSVSPGGWVLSWVLLLVYAVPAFILIYVLDLYEREPASLIVASLLWGAFGATTLTLVASAGWDPLVADLLGRDLYVQWGAAIIAPPIEEILKGLAVVFVILIARREVDDVMDGFVYGAMAGLGFTVVEDVLYFIGQFGGTPGGILEGFFVRVVAGGVYGHVLYSGLFGMGVAYFATRRREASVGKRLGVAGGLILLAIGAHFLWNSPLLDFYPDQLESAADYGQVILATTAKGLPFLAFLALMVSMGRRREHRWLRACLLGEVGREGIHPQELEVLESPSARRKSRREMTRRAGPLAGKTLKRLYRAQITLAMIRSKVGEKDDHPDLVRQRQYCKALRDWLVAVTGGAQPAARPG